MTTVKDYLESARTSLEEARDTSNKIDAGEQTDNDVQADLSAVESLISEAMKEVAKAIQLIG